jgi:hypothetical protein
MKARLLATLFLLIVPALLFVSGPESQGQAKKDKTTKKDKKKKDQAKKPPPKKTVPSTGKVFVLRPDVPSWATCDVEFRDPADNLWPNFFHGRPGAQGTFSYDGKAPKASFVLSCDTLVQGQGDQSRRVLGELLGTVPAPAARLTVRSLGQVRSEVEETTDDRGETVRQPVEFAPLQGTLEVAGRQVDVNGKARYRFNKPRAPAEVESVVLDLRFKVRASDLGLTRLKGNVECRAGAVGYATPKKK